MRTPSELRTSAVAAVLDAVRISGRSAFPNEGQEVAELVFCVAVVNGWNPVQVQREVTAYADALDRA